jgi:hypothetical protein
LLILGASAVIRQAGRRGASARSWLAQMLARKPKMLVTVAFAKKDGSRRLGSVGQGRRLQSSGHGSVS